MAGGATMTLTEELGYSTEEAEEMLEEFENPEAVVAKDYERRFGNGAGI
jgi:hypothetical protein